MQPHPSDFTSGRLLTVAEARAEIGVGLSTFNKLVMTGDIRVVWIGSVRRVRRGDLDEFLSSLPTSKDRA